MSCPVGTCGEEGDRIVHSRHEWHDLGDGEFRVRVLGCGGEGEPGGGEGIGGGMVATEKVLGMACYVVG